MQIEVVHDGSADDLAAQTARRVDGGRVKFHAEAQNRGLANTWNRRIERARGHWVHILHQDDTVLPGFYERLRQGAEQSDASLEVFCRDSAILLIGRCGNESPLSFRSGLSLKAS
jgi:glycosyltransferase involved in cell wall biosynthesis